MVKLTPELIHQSPQYINPVRERELELRGYKIPVIENLGATLDQFDTIDLSDNDIRKLDGFPLLRRLKCLLLNNNRIVRIAEGLEEFLPNLQSLVMTNNLIQELGDLDTLLSVKSLQILSLLKNPVTTKKHYRAYVVHKLPQLKLLDFRKIKQRERDEANALFQSKMGKQLEKDIAKRSKTFVPGASLSEVNKGPSPADVIAIKDAISKAKSLEEIERLNMMLKSGFIPGKEMARHGRSNDDREEMEEMDTDNMNGM